MGMSIEDAYSDIRKADEQFETASSLEGPSKDGRIRMAYYHLYQATTKANTLFLIRERKGAVDEGGLLTWARTEYDEFVLVLYQTYYKQGGYPRFNVEEDFRRWLDRVRGYVERLSDAFKLERSARPARGRQTDIDVRLDKEKLLKDAGKKNWM